jgi:hypothetical protein
MYAVIQEAMAFASVTAVKYNGNLPNWIDSHQITFLFGGDAIAAMKIQLCR